MSTEGVLKLLIDTNVWMDYFLAGPTVRQMSPI